jgi:hypothetical protein
MRCSYASGCDAFAGKEAVACLIEIMHWKGITPLVVACKAARIDSNDEKGTKQQPRHGRVGYFISFRRAFKRHTGHTAAAFRRRYRVAM